MNVEKNEGPLPHRDWDNHRTHTTYVWINNVYIKYQFNYVTKRRNDEINKIGKLGKDNRFFFFLNV